MKPFITALLLTAVCGYASTLFAPWWAMLISSFIIAAAIPMHKPFHAFLAAFLGIFILYLSWLLIINTANEGLLAGKIAQILGLGSGTALLLVTVCMYALLSGWAGLAGFWLRTGIRR